MKGIVFDIQRFSVHDGPGVRTTVFLKGCSLRCLWCHNPEGLNPRPQLQYVNELCIGCGECVSACPKQLHRIAEGKHEIDFAACTACGKCVAACPAKALGIFGRSFEPEELMKEIRKDKPFYGEEGGMTFSGGEPLLQADFIAETAAICQQEGIHVTIDTSGNVAWSAFEKVLPYADLFLYDIKAAGAERHKQGTGMENGRILENFMRLSRCEKPIWVRMPMINGYNTDIEEVEGMAQIIARNPAVTKVTPIPFHKLGSNKYEQIGLTANCGESQIVPRATMDRIMEQMRKYHLNLEV